MKVRCVTFGIQVTPEDFLVEGELNAKFNLIGTVLTKMTSALNQIGYEVQTVRVSMNSFEQWLLPLYKLYNWSIEDIVDKLSTQLRHLNIQFCSIGDCSSDECIDMLPNILAMSNALSSSVSFKMFRDYDIAPNYEMCQRAAKVCLSLLDHVGDLGNFRYCTSFNCNAGTPFFPVSYHQGADPAISVGFENGDLLFLAFFGVTSFEVGRNNLISIMRQTYGPLQSILQSVCDEYGVVYRGIDASLNPGLTIPDSIALGLENLIFPTDSTHFGSMGTLAAVSTVTSAVKALALAENGGIKLVGYNGIMLPVMEDLRLAELANRLPSPAFTLRDLLTFSSVCGVGLDTVPIPGNTTVDELAGVYMEVGAMAFRLNKPLTCRLLPMRDKVAGDLTSVDSPYLCNCRVFALGL